MVGSCPWKLRTWNSSGGWLVLWGMLCASAWGCGKSNGSHPSTSGAGGSSSGASGAGEIQRRERSSGAGAGSSRRGRGRRGAATGWQYAKIGGGGFITGGQVARDGTKFFRTDTSGGYLYDDTTGHLFQIVPRNLPAGTNVFLNGTGCYEMLISWTNSKLLYAAYGNALYRSTDGGDTFTSVKSGFTFDSNGGGMRTYERHGQIDPQNPDHLVFGDQVGLYRTTDGGTTWSPASGTPASGALNGDTAGWSGVAFNPTSPLTGGLSSEAIASTGGLYFRTADGGKTWSDISSGGPSDEPAVAEYDGQGRYFASLASGGIWRYASGAWKNLEPPSDNFSLFFLDPTNDSHVVLVERSRTSPPSRSRRTAATPGIRTSTGRPTPRCRSTTSPGTRRTRTTIARTSWSTRCEKVIWTPGGNQGLESIPLTALSAGPPYTADMHGIGVEDMCINTMVAPTGSKKLHAVVDGTRVVWAARSRERRLSVDHEPHEGRQSRRRGASTAPKPTATMLARWLDGAIGSGAQFAQSGWSSDDGATCKDPVRDPARGHDGPERLGLRRRGLAVLGPRTNIIVVSSNTNGVSSTNGQLRMPYYTLDRGATWHPVTLPTAWTQANVALVHQAYYLNRQILVADAATPARFYFLVYASDASFAGVYRTDDGGVTWTQTSPLPPTPDPSIWQWNAHLKSPVQGHLWMTAGEEGGGSPVGVGQLWRSTDGGMTFTPLPGVLEPNNIAFGAPAHAGGYPVLFMSGYYQGQPGMWMTADADDASPKWISLGAAPNDQYAGVNYMEGDPDVPGRVWVATGCAGVQLGDFASLLP